MSEQIFDNLDAYYYLFQYMELREKILIRQTNKFHMEFISEPIILDVVDANTKQIIGMANDLPLNLFMKSCAVGKIALVKYLHKNHRCFEVEQDIIIALFFSIENNRLDIFYWLKTIFQSEPYYENLFNMLCRRGSKSSVKKIYNIIVRIYDTESIKSILEDSLSVVCNRGNLEIFKFLHGKLFPISELHNWCWWGNIGEGDLYTLFELNHLPILNYLFDNCGTNSSVTRAVLSNAFYRADIATVNNIYKFVESRKDTIFIYYNELFDKMCETNTLVGIEWMCQNKPAHFENTFKNLEYACKNKLIDLVKILLKYFSFDKIIVKKYILRLAEVQNNSQIKKLIEDYIK